MSLYSSGGTESIVFLTRRLSQWRMAAMTCFVLLLAAAVWIGYQWGLSYKEDMGIVRVNPNAPLARQVKELLRPLRYNFIPKLLTPNVQLAMDVGRRRWYLLNVREYDSQGHIRLTEGRYGVCGDLAAFVYEKIRPLLSPRYVMEYVRVDESNYFFAPESTHYVLRIADTENPEAGIFILDPSFRRYGPVDDFDDYFLRKNVKRLELLERKATYDVFAAGEFTPILIRRESMLGLSVRSVNNRWDFDNYEVAILSTRKHRYTAHFLLALRKSNGQKEYFEDKDRALRILSQNDYAVLRKRVVELFESISATVPSDPPPPGDFPVHGLWNMRPEEIQKRFSRFNSRS